MPTNKPKRGPTFRFSNVDLEVESKDGLELLINELDRHAHCLDGSQVRRRGKNYASFELHRQPTTPDAGVRAFARVIAALPSRARRIWKSATKRDLNVGVEAAQRAQEFTISSDAVALAGKIGASITFTVYPVDPNDDWKD